jgi:hypothetical protein
MENLKNLKKWEEDYQNLKTLLIKNLPKKINGWNDKNHFHFRENEKQTSFIIENCKWIEYNQSWVNFIIIDIDNNFKEEVIKKCLNLGIEPTIICDTDKGSHCFFHLENVILETFKGNVFKYLRDIKICLTDLLGGDIQGSHRTKGIWRNPLQLSFFHSNISYSLNDFKDILIEWREKQTNANQSVKERFKNTIKRNNLHLGKSLFVKGNRDYFLFIEGMKFSKNKNLEIFEIENYLLNLQNQFEVEKLKETEIKRISRSVHKYNTQNKNFITNTEKKKTYNEGVMGFIPINEMERMTQEEIKEEIKRRQTEAGKRTQKITKTYKGKEMTRIEIAKKMTEEKVDKNRKKIFNVLSGLFSEEYKKKNGTWNCVKINEVLKIDIKTVRKYVKEYEELKK